MEPTPTLARRFWAAIEPLHAVVYFAPEPAEAARRAGLRGFWMGYFASRVAPLGKVPAEAVGAMAYGFAPHLIARAIPDAWKFAAPEAVLDARLTSAAEALRRHLKDTADLEELGEILWAGIDGCRFDGRPLAAAWSCVPRPEDPVASTWLAATVLREHRGMAMSWPGSRTACAGSTLRLHSWRQARSPGLSCSRHEAGTTKTGTSRSAGCRRAACWTATAGSPRPVARCAGTSRT